MPKTNWIAVIVLWLCGVASAMQIAKVSVTFDGLISHLNTDNFGAGLILSGVGFLAMFLGLITAPIIERFGYKRVLLITMFLGALFSVHQAFEVNWSIFFISRVLEGVSMLGIVVAAPVLITRYSSPQRVSISLALWATFFGVGFAFTGWLAAELLPHFGLPSIFISHAIIMVALGLLSWLVLRNSDAQKTIANQADSKIASGFATMGRELISGLRNIRVLGPGLIFLSHTAIYTPIVTFIPPLMEQPSLIAQMLVVLPAVSVLGTLISGPIAQYLVKPPLLAGFSFLVMGIVLTLMLLLVNEITILVALSIVLMFVSGLIQGAAFSAVPYLNTVEEGQALANSGLAQLGNIGSALGPIGFAVLVGVGTAPFFFGLIAFCAIGLLIALVTESLKRRSAQLSIE